jgi:hypothetical protein
MSAGFAVASLYNKPTDNKLFVQAIGWLTEEFGREKVLVSPFTSERHPVVLWPCLDEEMAIAKLRQLRAAGWRLVDASAGPQGEDLLRRAIWCFELAIAAKVRGGSRGPVTVGSPKRQTPRAAATRARIGPARFACNPPPATPAARLPSPPPLPRERRARTPPRSGAAWRTGSAPPTRRAARSAARRRAR